MEYPTVIYEPNQRGRQGWIKSWIVLTKNAIKSKDLIIQLFKRDFLMSYKKSFLGMSWLIITPIMGIISWVIMNSTGILKPGDVGIPYPAYVLLSTTIFGLFLNIFTSTSGTLTAGSGFILQVNFAHDALLIKQIIHQTANFFITFALIIVVLLFFRVVPSWQIIFFPILLIPLILLGSAIGLLTSIIIATDLQKGITFLMGLVMYITPVIYSPKVSNVTLQRIIKYNPLTYLIDTARDSLVYGKVQDFDKFLLSSAVAVVLFLIAWRFFYVSEQKVIEKMI